MGAPSIPKQQAPVMMQPPPPPPPAPDYAAEAAKKEAAEKQRKLALASKGLGSTILTSGLGLTKQPDTEKKKLLGS